MDPTTRKKKIDRAKTAAGWLALEPLSDIGTYELGVLRRLLRELGEEADAKVAEIHATIPSLAATTAPTA